MNGFKQDDRHLTGEFIPFPHDASSFKKIREINISIVDLEDCIFSAEVPIKGMTLSKNWHIRNVIKMPKNVVNTHDTMTTTEVLEHQIAVEPKVEEGIAVEVEDVVVVIPKRSQRNKRMAFPKSPRMPVQ